ncbi:MAG: hypothetical protein LN417_03580 [Candidatus Thermoplasmatota archaeon]|nr:hypothetical protein [Candidatus Thermoplasmatota archaeon]
MNHYVGMLKIEPAVRLRKALELSFHGTQSGNPKVHMRDILMKDEFGTEYESGIQFGVEVEAEDIEQARQRSGRISDSLCTFLSFLTGIALPVVETVAILQAGTEEREGQEYVQFFEPPLAMTSRRQLDVNDLLGILNSLTSCKDEWRERIQRTLRWYRRASLEKDVIDSFTASWIAMETLSPPLAEKLALKEPARKCQHCGGKLASGVQLEGLKVFFQENMPEGRRLFRRSYELRNKLLHGGGKIGKEIKRARELLPKLREGAVKAICFLLDFTPNRRIPTAILDPDLPFKMSLETEIFRLEDEPLEKLGEFPVFDIHIARKGSFQSETENLGENVQLTLGGVLARKVRMSRTFKISLTAPEVKLDNVEISRRKPSS